MKFVSSMNMEHCSTEEGIEKLCHSLMTFIKDHKVMDSAVFDDVCQKARNLGNRKLMDQCRVARARCEETRQVLRVREATVYKAREELEAQRARLIPLEQLAANTNITPIQAASFNQPSSQEDIWVPINPTTASSSILSADINKVQDDKNNNSANSMSEKTSPLSKPAVSRSSPSYLNKSCDSTTAGSSQEDLNAADSQESLSAHNDADSSKTVTPIVTQHQMESSLIKRRSFGGFKTQSSSHAVKSKLHQPLQPQTISDTKHELSGDQNLTVLDDGESRRHSSVIERLQVFGEPSIIKSHVEKQSKGSSIQDSTGSSGSVLR